MGQGRAEGRATADGQVVLERPSLRQTPSRTFARATSALLRDSGIATWANKRKYDAVRPFSAIRHAFGSKRVTAWGGPYQGTVSDLPADEWTSFGKTADHPEYPSASACFCAAHAQAARKWQGDDALGVPVAISAGSSNVEPGATPATDLRLFYPTWTSAVEACGQSRVDAGASPRAVKRCSAACCMKTRRRDIERAHGFRLTAGYHFPAAVDASFAACPGVGDEAYAYVRSLMQGTAPPRGPSQGRPFRGGR